MEREICEDCGALMNIVGIDETLKHVCPDCGFTEVICTCRNCGRNEESGQREEV